MTIANKQLVEINKIDSSIIEKVILQNDLAGLNSLEKVNYVNGVCYSLGLNPATRPIQLIKFDGKETMYCTKDATEQLRNIHNVSLSIKETKIIDDLYIVIAEARLPNGRTDSSTAAINISQLKGLAKANAIMKAETKAKRRVTLSICGLGFLDESELDGIPSAKKVDLTPPTNSTPYKADINLIENKGRDISLASDIEAIRKADNIDDLEKLYKDKYRFYVDKRDKESLAEIIKAKDERKDHIQATIDEFNKDITQ